MSQTQEMVQKQFGQKPVKIGFFGGTFDPIHFGHLNLAIQIFEIHQLNEIIFCPANFSPHKNETAAAASNTQRMEMVSLAISEIESFSITDVEINRMGPSYSVDTIHLLKKLYPKAEMHLILGEDQLTELNKWKEIEELLILAPPLIGSRMGKFSLDLHLSEKSLNILRGGITKISIMEISSTIVRKRLKQKKYCGHLIPSKVLDYINRNQIY